MSDVDLSGKLIAQRYIYRLSPTKSSVTAPYTIEERQYYAVSEDRTSLEPYGDKRFFLRAEDDNDVDGTDEDTDDTNGPPEGVKKSTGQPRTYTRIGSPLYKMIHDVKASSAEDEEDEEDGELGLTVWNSSFAMTLYCMANPHLVKGNVLELGSGVGISGILSCIGAGFASAASAGSTTGAGAGDMDTDGGGGFQSIEDIGMKPPTTTNDNSNNDNTQTENESSSSTTTTNNKSNYAPVPPQMSQLTLTDHSLPVLKRCVTNIKNAAFPPSKVDIHKLDWSDRIPPTMVGKFDCIFACDCAYYFPLVAPLARTMAYSLRPSPYVENDYSNGQQKQCGTFLHVGPDHRESIGDLRTKLSRGYRMQTMVENLVLEQFDLVPLVLDSLDAEEEQLREEVEGGGVSYAEYQTMDTSRFTAVVGFHHEDYDGVNGDYFFPVETGNEDNYGSDGKGRELGYGTDGDGSGGGGGGQWLG